MLHKTITYKDIDDNEVSEDFWFQISRDEVVEKTLVEGGEDYLKKLEELSTSRDGKQIMSHFKDILGTAVGKREGKLFKKTPEIRDHFLYSGAYGQFFMDLLTSPDSGAGMISAMMPADAQQAVREEMKKRGMTSPAPQETVVELPSSGVIEGVVQDTAVQADKPQPEPTPAQESDDPLWLREGRQPTKQEMMKMSKEDMQLVFKMREAGLIS